LKSALLLTFSSYGELLKIRQARWFVLAGFVGRYPISMRALAVLLLVLATYDSYALAGAVSSVVTLTNAAMVPMLGRLSDRRGQRRVILTAMVFHAGGVIGLILLAQLHAPIWMLFVAAAVFGSSALPLGSLVRARWAALVGGTPRLPAAYALEAFNDDIIYLSGPVVVTVLAAELFPAAALFVVLALVLVGWTALALQRGTEPTPASPADRPKGSVISEPGMRALVVVIFILGAWLGTSNVSMVAFAEEHGVPGFGGVLIGLMVFAGSVTGLIYGGVTWRLGLVPRLLATAAILAAGTLPLVLANSLWLMSVLALVAGLAITPMLITIYSLLTNLVPKTSVTEGFAWVASSITVGSSAGVAMSGYLVDRFGSSGALQFFAACAAAVPLVVISTRTLLARTPYTEQPHPTRTPANPS
jgi:MFS family permease